MNRVMPIARIAAALALAVLGGNVALAADTPVELSCHFEAAHDQPAPQLTQTSPADYGSLIAAQLTSRELSCNVVDKPAVINDVRATPVAREHRTSLAAL